MRRSPLRGFLEPAPHLLTGGGQIDRNYNLGYAYWDKTKYYQQKATLDQGGRYTYTDYYSNAAAQGSRGQQEYVYDPKNCPFFLNTNITPPAGTPQSEYWRYQLQPVNAADYSATFDYDQEGRCTQVYKLQSTTGGTYSYVETLTAYGSNGSPSWGAASSVTENYGRREERRRGRPPRKVTRLGASRTTWWTRRGMSS